MERMAIAASARSVQLIDQARGRGLQFGVGHAFGDHPPVVGLWARNAARAHHDDLGAGDSDHLLQPR